MTTLAIALAQSPIRAAAATSATQPQSLIEVRALLTDLRATGQQTWTRQVRYELCANGVPTVTGSYREITTLAAHLPGLLDWQPMYERAAAQPTPLGVGLARLWKRR